MICWRKEISEKRVVYGYIGRRRIELPSLRTVFVMFVLLGALALTYPDEIAGSDGEKIVVFGALPYLWMAVMGVWCAWCSFLAIGRREDIDSGIDVDRTELPELTRKGLKIFGVIFGSFVGAIILAGLIELTYFFAMILTGIS